MFNVFRHSYIKAFANSKLKPTVHLNTSTVYASKVCKNAKLEKNV